MTARGGTSGRAAGVRRPMSSTPPHASRDAASAEAGALQRLSAALGRTLARDEVADVIVTYLVDALGAHAGAVLELTRDGAALTLLGVRGAGDEVRTMFATVPADAPLPVRDVVRSREPVFVENMAAWARAYAVGPHTLPPGAADAAWAALPLVLDDELLGALTVSFAAPRTFAPDVRAFMRAFADLCAQALERARLYESEREARARAESLSARLADVLDTMSDALFEYDRAWRLVRMNAAGRAWLLDEGTAADGALGTSYEALHEGGADREALAQLERAMRGGASARFRALSPRRARWIETRAFPTQTGLAIYMRDVDAEARAEERLKLLADAGRALAAQLDVGATLEAIGRLAVPRFADGCTIDLRRGAHAFERVVHVHRDPGKAALLAESALRNPDATARAAPEVMEQLAVGRGLLVPEVMPETVERFVPHPAQRARVEALGMRSYILVPLMLGGVLLGGLGFIVTESARRYDADDLALAEELARRAAVALENARLYEAEHRARGDAESANRAKMDFLATMSHELRTPLNAIGGHAQLIQLGIHGPLTEAQRGALERIQASQAHLLGLITDVLNFAKLDAGKIEFRPADVRLHEVVDEITALVAPQFEAKGVAYVHGECDAGPSARGRPAVAVRADPDKLRQIMLNLLSNAAKYTLRGGSVTIQCAAGDGVASTVVRDTGIGIPHERLEQIFEPFVQLGRSLATPVEGTGLGLAISRDLARAMGGDLTVDSTLGAGSTFTLTLPRA